MIFSVCLIDQYRSAHKSSLGLSVRVRNVYVCLCMHAWMSLLEKIKSYINFCYTCFTSLQQSATCTSASNHVYVHAVVLCGAYMYVYWYKYVQVCVYMYVPAQCIIHVCIVEGIIQHAYTHAL